ncbi:MAG: trimethylamine methyltransferase family protein [Dehalobacterium sp.]
MSSLKNKLGEINLKRNLTAGHAAWSGWRMNMFSDYELEAIHLGTLEVMEETGLFIESNEAIDIFEKGGAKVDRQSKIVKVPRYLVEEALRTAPSGLTLAARNPKHDFVMELDRVGFCAVGVSVSVVDLYTGEVRNSTKKDVENCGKLADALDNYDICFDTLLPRDVPSETACLHGFDAFINTSSKHVLQTPTDKRTAEVLIEMASIVAGGKDKLKERAIVMGGACPQSPLAWSTGACDSVIEYARFGLPNLVVSMVMAGGSGPVTLAGTLIVHNAEILTGLVLSQLVRKGNPCIYGSCTTIMDLRKAVPATGCPEHGMFSAACARLAQFYKIPNLVAGTWTDSKVSDMQAAHEKTLSAVLPALAGANLITGAGTVESGLAIDFGQLVVDNEFHRLIKRVLKGMPVDDYSMVLDLIKKVGPRGNYLAEEHTLDNMRSCQTWPNLFDRNNRMGWVEAGSKDLAQKGNEKAREILETYTPEKLPSNVSDKLTAIISDAEKDFGLTKK